MTGTKCSALKGEGLYVIEVFVDTVSLYAEKIEKIDPSSLAVDINLIDLPQFRIFQTEFQLTNEDKKQQTTRDGRLRTVSFNAGKKYLFARNPSDLVGKLRAEPLALDVYRVKQILICPREVIKEPLGIAKFSMPGCLCDQVMMASNDIYHLPRSYQIKNSFGLIDEEYKPSGFISLLIRLTCYGKSIKSSYSIVDQKLLFKNDGSNNEFLGVKVPYLDEKERRAAEDGLRICSPGKVFEESELDAPPRPCNVAGLVLVCQELAKTDGYPVEACDTHRKTFVPKTVVEEVLGVRNLREKFQQQYTDLSFNEANIGDQNRLSFKRGACTSTGCGGTICTGIPNLLNS